MRQIVFKDIAMSYFLSTGKEVKYVYEDGIFFIRGENKSIGQEGQNNGVGKTNIFFDSLVFAMYGETSRKGFPKSSIPFNRGGKKKCCVELKFNIEENDTVTPVVITRTINPSKVTLFVDGVDKTQSNSKSTQEYLVNTILKGIKKDVFMQSVALKADNNSIFLMGKPEREKFVGTIFDFTYIKEGEKLIREEYNKLARTLEEKTANLSYRESKLDDSRENIKVAKKEIDAKLQKKKDRLKDIEQQIKDFEIEEKPEVVNVETETNKCDAVISKVGEKFNETETARLKAQDRVRKNKERLASVEAEIKKKKESKVCIECGQDLDEEHRKAIDADCEVLGLELESLPKEIESIHDRFLALSGEKDLLELKLKTLREGKNKIVKRAMGNQKEIFAWETKKKDLKNLEELKEELEEEIEQPTDSSILKSLVEKYKTDSKEYEELKVEVKGMEKDLTVLEQAKFVYSEKGLRSLILSKMINLFNASLNNYLMKFQAPCKVEFDENMDYVITNLDGKEVEYESFSGGEKWRINMGLVFTFSDVLRIQNQIGFNVKLVDEFFDGAVDKAGLDIISEILVQRQQAYNENFLIITHKTEFDIPDAQVIDVVKEGGESRIL